MKIKEGQKVLDIDGNIYETEQGDLVESTKLVESRDEFSNLADSVEVLRQGVSAVGAFRGAVSMLVDFLDDSIYNDLIVIQDSKTQQKFDKLINNLEVSGWLID
ncbi:MAG: hypothetical protein AB7V16_07015 [Vulcanibacillus sp.]